MSERLVDRTCHWNDNAQSQYTHQGYAQPKEAKLHANYSAFLPQDLKPMLLNWWLAHTRGANVPNWDLAATCSIGGRRGLVLLEAKAHENELSPAGKVLRPDAPANSRENHERIDQAIEEARQALDRLVPGVRISRDSHYQLSNRVAYAWKLASLGIPNVLIYLGLIGDTGIPERLLPCGEATMQLVVRSQGVW